MEEIWKDIPEFEDGYMISNLGRVYSKYTKKIRKTQFSRGYESITLKRDRKQHCLFVHRLVAQTFLPNPNNLPIVNHKDENPMNNCVDNLEWCTYSYNNSYNGIAKKKSEKFQKKVYVYDKEGNLEREYSSVREAERDIKGSSGSISMACRGLNYTYQDKVWSYEPLEKEEILQRFELSHNDPNFQKNYPSISKTVNQFDLDMNFIASYPSTREAGRVLGFSSSLIAGVCRGEHKQTHGYIFRYSQNGDIV